MLFWLFIIAGVIGVGLVVIGGIDWDSEKYRVLWRNNNEIRSTGWTFIVVAAICVAFSLLIISFNFIGVDADIAKHNERYEALVYKMESGSCRDEFGLLSKDVIDEIQHWNEDVVHYQSIQNDFWIGIYYPNIFNQFKTIDYNTYAK